MLKYIKLVEKLRELPTLPTIYAAFCEAAYDENSNSKKFAELIMPDQATSAKILKIANSAFFGFVNKIESIPHAITLLGLNEIRNILIAMEIIDFFNTKRNVVYFKPVHFWRHSIATGIMSRLIAEKMKVKKMESYFLSGILHDIGKLFLFKYEEHDFELCLKLAMETKKSLHLIEKEIIGIDHTTIGLLIAKKWNLPESIYASIQYHHEMDVVPPLYGKLVSTVHISDIISRMWNLGYGGDDLIPEPAKNSWEILDLPLGFFKSIEDKFFGIYDHTCAIMLN